MVYSYILVSWQHKIKKICKSMPKFKLKFQRDCSSACSIQLKIIKNSRNQDENTDFPTHQKYILANDNMITKFSCTDSTSNMIQLDQKINWKIGQRLNKFQLFTIIYSHRSKKGSERLNQMLESPDLVGTDESFFNEFEEIDEIFKEAQQFQNFLTNKNLIFSN